PLIARIVEAAKQAGCDPVLVVTGAVNLAIPEAQIVHNADWQTGLASSLRAGLSALPDVEAALIALSDQPLIEAHHLAALIQFFTTSNQPAAASQYGDFGGPPAIFDKSLFPELSSLKGDTGAKPLLRRLGEKVAWFPLPEAATDIDTPLDLQKLK